MASTSTRSLRACLCQVSQGRAHPVAPATISQFSRQASTSTSTSSSSSKNSNTASDKPSLWQRIAKGAQKGAIDRRAEHARVDREMRRMEQEQGNGSLFDRVLSSSPSTTTASEGGEVTATRATDLQQVKRVKEWTEHKTSTGLIATSPQKLNEVARLLQKKPIDYAILQAQMSDKRVAKGRVKSMLCLARDHAVAKGLEREKLIVTRAWVTKGVYLRRLDIKGRGRFGVKMRPESRLHVILAHGPSRAEIKQAEFDKRVKQRLRTGAGYVRADRPIINLNKLHGSGAAYAW